jgi:hypothetical protein
MTNVAYTQRPLASVDDLVLPSLIALPSAVQVAIRLAAGRPLDG